MATGRILWGAVLFTALLVGCNETVEVGDGNPGDDTTPNNQDSPNNQDTPNNQDAPNNQAPPMGEGLCNNGQALVDDDLDGFGTDGDSVPCTPGDELEGGTTNTGGDCGPGDPLRHPDAEGICGDWVDDDCDGSDEACPTSQPTVEVPEWDCTGEAPSSVYAWARFESGGGFFQDGGCFFFFEGAPGEFYVKRNVERVNQDPGCETRNGCVCPSLNNRPSYDRRMYAFTSRPDFESCPEISIRDHAGEEQPVSNECRKYLYQMHGYDIPYSFIAGSEQSLRQRLEAFDTVEIACVEDAPHSYLPFQSLINATVELNPGFAPR